MDADVVLVPAGERGRLTGEALRSTIESLDPADRARIFAIIATAGTTNVGVVDDLRGVGDVCAELGTWMHVDGAYGGAALAAPSVRHLFDGIEAADSFIVDPHKWLFAPFDSLRPALPRSGHRSRRAHPARRVPRRAARRAPRGRALERQRLRPSPVAPGAGAAVLVQPRDPRHRRLHRCRRDHPAGHPRRRTARRRLRRTPNW